MKKKILYWTDVERKKNLKILKVCCPFISKNKWGPISEISEGKESRWIDIELGIVWVLWFWDLSIGHFLGMFKVDSLKQR